VAISASGSSLGTLINCVTYLNGRRGMSFVGTAAHPLNAVRIDGGFVGEDTADGIYLDTYSSNHSVSPQYIELSGGSNILLTTNNDRVTIRTDHCGGAGVDGVTATGVSDLMVHGGAFVNNGVGGGVCAGIRVDGGSASISNIVASDNGAGQDYGLIITGDNVIVTGSRLTGNATGPISWTTGPTNSAVTGCLPFTANYYGDVTARSVGVGIAATGVAGQFRANGSSSFSAGLTISAGGLAVTGGIVADNAAFSVSIGVGAVASGVVGRIDATDALFTGSVRIQSLGVGMNATGVVGEFRANAAVGFNGGVTITAGGLAVTGGMTIDNIAYTGTLYNPAAGALGPGTINVAGSVNLNGVAYTNP
jgi:hypothetical protein